MAYYQGGGGFNNFDEGSGGYNPRFHYQAAQNAGFHTGSSDEQPRTLYVGNLDSSVTEDFIGTLFGQVGTVTKTKVIFDGHNDPYAFVEFGDHTQATNALQVMNRRMLLEREMKVNWATEPGQQQAKVDTSKHFHVFVGDLSPEVDNKTLKEAFIPFGEVSDAKVIRDPGTLKSKGYGFVSYPKREEAERAIEQMNGQWLGRRTIRTNWATRKPQEGGPAGGNQGGGGGFQSYGQKELDFDDVMQQTAAENTSVYVGNVPSGTTEEEIREAFSKFGRIEEVRIFKAQGYSFVRYAEKEPAARAIVEMNGKDVCGQSVRCSWGKTDSKSGGGNQQYNNYGAGAYGYGGGGSGGQQGGYGGQGGQGGYAAQQQQYWNYYQQYYNNPQYQQQWAQYYQQQNGGGKH